MFLGLFVADGCTEKPKAPPLVNETVYQNDKIGLRFLAPEGWSVSSRAELPAVGLPKPIIVIAYQFNKGETHSELEVLAADLSENADLVKFLVEHRIGSVAWKPKPPPESVTINGATALRFTMSRVSGKAETRREATAFRRGGRVYFFIITFPPTDAAARDAARQSVQSVTWTGS